MFGASSELARVMEFGFYATCLSDTHYHWNKSDSLCVHSPRIRHQWFVRQFCRPLNAVITSTNEVMFSSLFVCFTVCLLATWRKNVRICMKFSGKVSNGPMNNRLNFGGDHRLGTGIIFRITPYWEIRKVVLLLHPVTHSYWFVRWR